MLLTSYIEAIDRPTVLYIEAIDRPTVLYIEAIDRPTVIYVYRVASAKQTKNFKMSPFFVLG